MSFNRDAVTRIGNAVRKVEYGLKSPTRFIESGESSDRWFILAADIESASQEEVYVWIGKLESGVVPVIDDTYEDPEILINVGLCLSPLGKFARAGFYGRMTPEGDKWVPVATYECLSPCTPAEESSLSQPDFDDATVDEAYTFTIEVTGDITDVNCSNLPDGLSFDTVTFEISGTPTTEGYKWVTVSGTSGTCTVTKLAKLTVLGAA